MISSKLEAQIWISGHTADKGTSGGRAAGGAARAALGLLRKRGFVAKMPRFRGKVVEPRAVI